MLYFAYGSNMSTARLTSRVPSAKLIGRFKLAGHRLKFHKVSTDGSAKCNAYQTLKKHDEVIGALFIIDPLEKPRLDQAEGLGQGYSQYQVDVYNDTGLIERAFTYKATIINDELKPYDWYLNHVLIGATETGLPKAYIQQFIWSVESVADKNIQRAALELAIHNHS